MPQPHSPPPGPPPAAGTPDAPVNFFRNYTRVIALAYAAILIGLVAFFAYQLQQKLQAEIGVAQASFQRYSQFIEFVIRSSADHLDTLQMMVEDGDLPSTGGNPPPDLSRFTVDKTAGELGFSLDAVPDRDLSGNIVGVGALTGRSPDFYEHLKLALVFNAGFRSLVFTLPNAVRARFISHLDFALFSPWRASTTQPFTRAIYRDPVWNLGLPNQNPDREKFWGPIYFSGKSEGLLVPVAVPVYRDDHFIGVLAIDTSIDYLNRINADFGYPRGTSLLVDARDRVLADPGWYANPLSMEQAPTLADALPATLKPHLADLRNLPRDQPTTIADQVVMRHHFISAPWTLIYTVPVALLWRSVLADFGPAMLAMVLGLAAVMGVTYQVTSREFVGPAAKLVRHLAAESRFQPTSIPMVPTAWRPWFETVTRAFRESIQLMALRQELDVAAKMQLALLPHAWPVDARYQLWGTMKPAQEVGGDFYDHFALAGGLRGVVVADVSGKGIGPGLFGMMAKSLLRATAIPGSLAVSAVIERVNDELSADNDTCIFVTLFYGLLHPDTGMLSYVNAGHPPPLLVHADGSTDYLPLLGGIAAGILPGASYPQGRVQLHPGDLLLVFSDGVTEAMNAANDEFGTARLAALFSGRPAPPPSAAVERTMQAVHAFAAGVEQSDDITCVALRYQPSAAAPIAAAEVVA